MRRRKPNNNNANIDTDDDARFPVRNEIPNSANVRANDVPGANVPVSSVQNERESRQQQLNLGLLKISRAINPLNYSNKSLKTAGGIIALGVFGGFVFLAAIITTIVILIRR